MNSSKSKLFAFNVAETSDSRETLTPRGQFDKKRQVWVGDDGAPIALGSKYVTFDTAGSIPNPTYAPGGDSTDFPYTIEDTDPDRIC